MAYESSLPPGRKMEDYLQCNLAVRGASAVLDIQMPRGVNRKAMRIMGYHDLLQNAIYVAQALGLSKRRLPEIVRFMSSLSIAHSVPSFLGDPSWRAIQELEREGRFPLTDMQTPPGSSFSDLASKVLATLDEWEKYKTETGSEVKEAIAEILKLDSTRILEHMQIWRSHRHENNGKELSNMQGIEEAGEMSERSVEEKMKKSQEPSAPTPSSWTKFDTDNMKRWKSCKIDILPYGFLFENLMGEFPKLPILLGFVHCILSQWPIEPLYELVKECRIPHILIKLIKADTNMGAITILFRCLATLLNPTLFGALSFPIIHNLRLRKQLKSLIPTYPVLHFPSLSAFLRNYATFICYTQLISDLVREEHLGTLILFFKRCIAESSSPSLGANDLSKLTLAIEDTIIGICNLIIANPHRAAPQAKKDIETSSITSLEKIGISPSLVSEFTTLLDRQVIIPALPKVSTYLTSSD